MFCHFEAGYSKNTRRTRRHVVVLPSPVSALLSSVIHDFLLLLHSMSRSPYFLPFSPSFARCSLDGRSLSEYFTLGGCLEGLRMVCSGLFGICLEQASNVQVVIRVPTNTRSQHNSSNAHDESRCISYNEMSGETKGK